MQAIDKLKSDLDEWARRTGPDPIHDSKALDALRITFCRSVGTVPEETLAGIFSSFLAHYGTAQSGRGGTKAVDWLAGVGSLLLMDYDGTPFTSAEWEEIRELITLDAGEIKMDVLSYVLAQVMDHGAL